ncbi:class I SAM-dependent methyltransferase [Candidatus Desantisbacteria bacterium]|nr:class I SAM-dependent methyltransferase [Candidatus Desantisbacteria bacterium]
MNCIYLKKKSDKFSKMRHPWIFKNSVEKIEEHNQTNAYRLIYSEADMLPGLIVDRYGDFLVIQALTAGIDNIKHILANNLMQLVNPLGIYERSDSDVRKLEGLEPVKGQLLGTLPPEYVEIKENGFLFLADIIKGQKTGLFLDQRNNRRITGKYAKNKNILDCFSYTGGFTVYAKACGAYSVTCIDSSENANLIAQKNFILNKILSGIEMINENVFTTMRKYRDYGKTFDMIIIDPPKLAPTRLHTDKAIRAYKDLNLLAMKLLTQGGILAAFSCSGGINAKLFREMISWAAIDAGKEIQILETLSQGPDHPIRINFPESEYLKGLILRIL